MHSIRIFNHNYLTRTAMHLSIITTTVFVLISIPNSYAFIVSNNNAATQQNRSSSDMDALRNLLSYEKSVRQELEHRVDIMEQLYKMKFDALEGQLKEKVNDLISKRQEASLRQNRTELKLNATESELRQAKADLSLLKQKCQSQSNEIVKLKNVSEVFELSMVSQSHKIQHIRLDQSNITTRLTSEGKQVFFRAALAQAMNNTGYVKVIFATVHYNLGQAYNASSGTFLAPRNGIYSFHVQGHTRPGNKNYLKLMQVPHGTNNGVLIGYAYSPSHSTDWNQNSISAGAYLKKGDSVWVESSVYLAESSSTFS